MQPSKPEADLASLVKNISLVSVTKNLESSEDVPYTRSSEQVEEHSAPLMKTFSEPTMSVRHRTDEQDENMIKLQAQLAEAHKVIEAERREKEAERREKEAERLTKEAALEVMRLTSGELWAKSDELSSEIRSTTFARKELNAIARQIVCLKKH